MRPVDSLHSQNLVVAQGLSGRAAIPAAVWDVPVGRDDVERVVDKVVLQDAVVGRAGCQRGGGVDLRGHRDPEHHIYIGKEGIQNNEPLAEITKSTVGPKEARVHCLISSHPPSRSSQQAGNVAANVL